jgi:pimeloyl-ACP methyl ester carboxylesterase
MTESTLRTLDLAEARVAYREAGHGEPLLLVHGYPLSSQTWRKVMPSLASSYRCIAVDLLGAGETELKSDADVSIPAQARMLKMLLDALEIPSITLIAHDSGAVIARLLAESQPARVRGLVLSDTEVPGRVVTSVEWMQRFLRIPGAFRLFEWLLQSPRFQRSRFGPANGFYDRSAVDLDEFLTLIAAPLLRSPAQRRASYIFAITYDLRFADRLRHDRLTMPKLVLWGDHDAFFPLVWGRELFELLPDPKHFVTLKRCGILPHEECPADWCAAVGAFLAPTHNAGAA